MDAHAPMDGATRQARYRSEQKKLGRRPRLFYLTDDEKAKVDRLLATLRRADPPK